MFLYKDILKDESKDHDILRQKSEDVVFPLSDEDKNTLFQMNEYLRLGYDEDFAKKILDLVLVSPHRKSEF